MALARAGVETWHAGLIGPEGRFLRETLDQAGVRTQFVEERDGSTGHAIIQVAPDGQNSILLHDGANGRVTPDFVAAVLAHFGPGDALLLQNETSATADIIQEAVRRGLRVAMNAAPANEKLAGLPLERLTWLLVNEVEGAFLAGTEDPEAILDTLTARYPETTVVLTLGGQGAAAARGRPAGPGASPAGIGGGHHRGRRRLHRLLPAPGSGGRLPGGRPDPGLGGQRPGGVPPRRGSLRAGLRRGPAAHC